MKGNRVKLALIGFGTVGTGVVKILQNNAVEITRKTGLILELSHVVDLDLTTDRGIDLPPGVLHNNLDRVLQDKEVAIAVVLIGGTTIAADVQKKLLESGKDIVTANKALLAERGEEVIFQTARKCGRCVSFEASCCGGIPLIGAVTTGLTANRIQAFYGIVNGTCNYILSGMAKDGKEYEVALKEAQEAGLAEADPTLDVNGADSAHKLSILALLAFGKHIPFSQIHYTGIDKVRLMDIKYGQEMGYVLKLLTIAEQSKKGLCLRVQPSFLRSNNSLAHVSGPFNAVSIFGDAVGHTLYYGQGAGMMPTASAVVADIIETARGNACRIFDYTPGLGQPAKTAEICPPEEIISRFYLRLSVTDRPGVLAQIARILGEKKISISECLQHEGNRDWVPLIIMTHEARQGDVNSALKEISRLDVVQEEPVCIQVVAPPS